MVSVTPRKGLVSSKVFVLWEIEWEEENDIVQITKALKAFYPRISTIILMSYFYASMFQNTKGVYTNRVSICVHPIGCTVHHLACTEKPRGHTGMGESVYICSCGVFQYCAIQNVIPEIH